MVVQAGIIKNYPEDVPTSHREHPFKWLIFLKQQLHNLNCNMIITKRYSIIVYNKVYIDTVTDGFDFTNRSTVTITIFF
jgi:hypothetical protein